MASENHNFSSFQLHYASPAKGKSPVQAENYNNNEIDYAYFDSFPPGYRFCPTEAELVLYYLKRKVDGQNLPKSKIMDVNLYHYNPNKLAELFKECGEKECGEKEWYFFTPRNKKYRNGKRPNRAAEGGYWKASGSDINVIYEGQVIGFKKSLVFYVGKAQKGVKTNWIMHEFRVVHAPVPQTKDQDDMQLDQWVLCKIYHRTDKSSTISTPTIQLIQEEEPRTATEDVNDQITIDANNNQQFNHKGDDFVYQGDTHNVDNYMSSYNYPEQLPLQEPLSFVNSNPYANIATQSDSPNFHGDMQQIFSNNSDLYANITADCASLNMHSDPMDENELWTIVDYPKDGFHTDF